MSSVFRGVRKVFKKVAKAVKKVLPVVLAAGALIFTGGAALGLTGVGWTGVAGKVGALFGEGVVGSVMTGAVKHAGVGALTGGVVAAATGQSVSKGMQGGALTGAVVGGAIGGLTHGAEAVAAVPGSEAAAGGGGLMPGEVAAPGGMGPPSMAPGAGGTATAGAGRGLFGKGGWLESNQTLAGNIVQGVGAGLSGAAENDALRKRDRMRRDNYAGADPSQGYRQLASPEDGERPSERFDHRRYAAFDYKYNRQTGRIERVPTGNG